VPDEWLTLVRGNPQTNAGFDFCSEKCLAQWMYGDGSLEQADKPQCKARRFLYVEDETGAKYEGILLGSGPVVIDFGQSGTASMPYRYSSWGALIRDMPDADRIIWIDQEQQA
jgi:hypothetical protein